MRVFACVLCLLATFGACTPEAIEVDAPGVGGEEPTGATSPTDAGGGADSGAPSGGAPDSGGSTTAGKGGSGDGGGGSGTAGNANNCAPLASPNDSCTQCMPEQCAATVAACTGSACTCGDYGGYKGQMNCLLACATLSPMMPAADVCAKQCGFGTLGASHMTTHALFDCLVNPPKGPPLCPQCFPVH